LRVDILTDYPERLASHEILYLGPDARPWEVKGIRFHKNAALVKLAGCDDRNAADQLRGQLVQIPADAAVPLEEGEYYHYQVVGMDVVTEEGASLGQVVEVLQTKANDVYVVRGPRGEILLPAIEDVVRELDLEEHRIVVHLLPGLLGSA